MDAACSLKTWKCADGLEALFGYFAMVCGCTEYARMVMWGQSGESGQQEFHEAVLLCTWSQFRHHLVNIASKIPLCSWVIFLRIPFRHSCFRFFRAGRSRNSLLAELIQAGFTVPFL